MIIVNRNCITMRMRCHCNIIVSIVLCFHFVTLSSGSCLPPDPGGDPHPVDHQTSVLQDLQTS